MASKPKVYIDACCFIELACYSAQTAKKERIVEIPFLRQILQAAFDGDIDLYTSVLTVAECRYANNLNGDGVILNDEIKQLFKDFLTSGQYVILVQDSILIAERARNLSWVHSLKFKGADAIHIASALEMKCDEFITFDERGPFKKVKELEELGITVLSPKLTKSLPKAAVAEAKEKVISDAQPNLPGMELTNEKEQAAPPAITFTPDTRTSSDGHLTNSASDQGEDAKTRYEDPLKFRRSPEVPAAKQEAWLVSPKSKTPVSAEPTGGQATNGNPGATPAAMPAPTAQNVSAKE